MKILEKNFEVHDMTELQIFMKYKSIIYGLLKGNLYNYNYCKDDIEQECALWFFKFFKKHYDYKKGVFVQTYLRFCYKRVIWKYLQKEIMRFNDEDINSLKNVKKLQSLDLHNWQVDNMEFSTVLTKEQKKILELILYGYNYSEICSIVCFKNKTRDKARPIYRRMCEIKSKIAKFLELEYKMPDHSGNIARSNRAWEVKQKWNG